MAILTFYSGAVKLQSQITGSFISYPEDDMVQDLMTHGFAELEGLVGVSTDDKNVSELVARATWYVSHRISQLVEEKKSISNNG